LSTTASHAADAALLAHHGNAATAHADHHDAGVDEQADRGGLENVARLR
jgi:hypothetical protein